MMGCARLISDTFAVGCIYDQPSVDRLQMLMKGGHQIASHTWSHTNLSLITRDQGVLA